LNNEISWFRVHFHLLVSNVGHCSIAFSNLLNHSDVEASSVLIVRHKSQTFGEFSQYVFLILIQEHSLLNDVMAADWNIRVLGILFEVRFSFFHVTGLSGVEDLPLGETRHESEVGQTRLQKSDFAFELFQGCSHYSFILNRVERASRIG
jgi:hypothetical protein